MRNNIYISVDEAVKRGYPDLRGAKKNGNSFHLIGGNFVELILNYFPTANCYKRKDFFLMEFCSWDGG